MNKEKVKRKFHLPGILAILVCIVGICGLYFWAGLPHQYNSFLPFCLVFMAYYTITTFAVLQFADMMGWLNSKEEKSNE